MSRNTRIGLLALAVVVAVAALIVAGAGGDGDENEQAATTPGQTTTSRAEGQGRDAAADGPTATGQDGPTATAESALPPPPTEIRLKGGRVSGGVAQIEATTGRTVRFVVFSDTPDDIHLHGYDIEKEAAPGAPARFRVKADLEGVFEIESHQAEDAGAEPLIARLVVEPS